MKILTKKKQKQILALLIKSGSTVTKDDQVPFRAYNRVNSANYDIANLVGGSEMVKKYYSAIDEIIQDKIAEAGGK